MPNILTRRREPFTFMLYLGMAGSCILFLFIFLVFVRKEILNQQIPLHLPGVFWWSTVSILLSSLSIEFAKHAFKREKFFSYRVSISLCFALSLLFLSFQFFGWQQLTSSGITMANSTSGSFIYILSGLHIVHTLVGIIGLTVVIRDAFSNLSYVDSFIYSVNAPNQLRLKLFSIYWHFLDALWLIIFLFLLYHAS
jgi:cytochrome c oxidase subunit 3